MSYHIDDNVVCVSIWHQTGQGSSTCHSETSTVIYDDKISTACFEGFGGQTDTYEELAKCSDRIVTA